MAVVYDSSSAGNQVSAVQSLTFSFNNASGSALVVGVGGTWPGGSSVSNIKYNNVTLTITKNSVETSNNNVIVSYAGGYLMGPATGDNNVEINMSNSTDVTWLNAVAVSVNGATGTPAYTQAYLTDSLTTSRTVTSSSQNNGIIVSVALLGGAANGNSSWSVDAQSNLRISATYVSPWVLKGATKTSGSPFTSITWSNSDGGSVARTSVVMVWAFPPREPVLGPAYYYDFQSDTVGYMPNYFTSYYDWNSSSGGGSWAVATVPGETSEKALSNFSKSGYGPSYAYNNLIGKITLDNQPIELAAKFKLQYKGSSQNLVAPVPGDCSVMGIGISDDGGGNAVDVILRYNYGNQFRIMAYDRNGANNAIAFQSWRCDGVITFSTSSVTVTGSRDTAPPLDLWFNEYAANAYVGQYYQITDLSNTDWNAACGTTGLTYSVNQVILIVNKPTGNGMVVRSMTTRFQSVGDPYNNNDGSYIGAELGLTAGSTLYTMDGAEIGIVQSIESPTSLTLTTNAKINGTGVYFKIHPDSFVPQTNTWYYIRYRREIGSIYKAKIWPASGVEPERWLLDSTSEKGQYSHNIVDTVTAGRLGVSTVIDRVDYYWAQWGVSLDGGVASLDGTFPPSISNVDGDNILTSSQTNIAISGNHLANVTTATVIQGSISIPQPNIIVNDETSITFNLTFDAEFHDVKYGSATLKLSSPTGVGYKSITVIPPDSRCYRNLTSINQTADNRITALPDLDIGDQIEVLSVNGDIISSVNINSDGTFDAPESVKSFSCRAWSAADQTWGNPGLQAMVTSAIRRRVIVIL